jgi:hypothetical protein
MGLRVSPGSLLIATPNLGSATANEAFFSSFKLSRSLASMGDTLPSTSAATSSRAVAALSNFSKCFNFKLHSQTQLAFCTETEEFDIRRQLSLQPINALGSLDVCRKISLLEYFTIFGFEEGKACARFGENEDAHRESSFLFASLLWSWRCELSRVEALKFLQKKVQVQVECDWDFGGLGLR